MTTANLIVLAAYDRNDEGDLVPAFDPRQVDTAERAVREAELLAATHASVMVWSRDADPALGEYGPPTILFKHGDIPNME